MSSNRSSNKTSTSNTATKFNKLKISIRLKQQYCSTRSDETCISMLITMLVITVQSILKKQGRNNDLGLETKAGITTLELKPRPE